MCDSEQLSAGRNSHFNRPPPSPLPSFSQRAVLQELTRGPALLPRHVSTWRPGPGTRDTALLSAIPCKDGVHFFLNAQPCGCDQADVFNRLSWRLVQAEGSDIQSVLVSTFQTRWFLGPPAHPRGAEFYRRHLSSNERAVYTLPTAWPSSGREGGDWNSPLGQTLLCLQAQREEEMPFHRSPRLRSFQLLCGDLPFLGHLTAGLSIQSHLSGQPCLPALQDGSALGGDPTWRMSKGSPSGSPQHQVKLLSG